MMNALNTDQIFNALSLPSADIGLLTFCGDNKTSKVEDWVNSLKTTQTLKTCGQLYQAIPQVLRLKTSASERKAMLDSLFLAAYPSCLNLGKEFLNQPLTLPEPAQRSAVLGQTILKSLATGYLVYLKAICSEKKLKSSQLSNAAQAIYHALECLALMQLRNQQLYSQASVIVWRYANILLQLATHLNVQEVLVKPRFTGFIPGTPGQVYLRMVALAGSRSNQLTQVDMGHVFNALTQWSKALQFSHEPSTFWINLQGDSAPQLQKRKPAPEHNGIIHIDFAPLSQQLTNLIEGEANIIGNAYEIKIPAEISSATAIHLESAWGGNSARDSKRRSSEHSAEIIIGFQQCHSKLSGIDDFNEFIGQTRATTKSAGMLANLMGALTPADNTKAKALSAFSPLKVNIQNVSKDGYCLIWEGAQAIRIDAGDIVIIREHGKRDWAIGVIRWIRKLKNHSMLGIQLLSTKAQAVGASCNYDDGGYSDFMRAFILPSEPPQQNPSLLTASILFDEHTKVKIKTDSQSKPALTKILECKIATGKAKAFELQNWNHSAEKNAAKSHEL